MSPKYDPSAGQKGEKKKSATLKELDTDALARRISAYIARSQRGEGARLRGDRMGARLKYGQHWSVAMPQGRSAVVCNKAGALVDHKTGIMTKQDPVPIIEPDEVGDTNAALLMRRVLMRVWREGDLKIKLRIAVMLCQTTRTSAFKVLWDHALRGGAGDIATDVIPGWKLLLDPNTNDVNRMDFVGDKQSMRRSRAMRLYPEAADEIREGPGGERQALLNPISSESPITTPWTAGISPAGGATTINQKAVLLTQVDTGPGGRAVGPDLDDQVQICEVYYRDPSVIEVQEPERDYLGRIKYEVVRGADNIPQIELLPDEPVYVAELNTHVYMPNFRVQRAPVMTSGVKQVYPYYRRTTLLMPDQRVIEDMPWDGPLPYALFSDQLALDGAWCRGGILMLRELQGVLNVAISAMTDNLRLGSMQVFKAGQMSGFDKDQVIITPGKVIRLQDEKALVPIEVPQVADSWIHYIETILSLMDMTFGAEGVMQGASAGRVDSSAGYDTLAEIGGSRIVESTQRMESALADWAAIAGWFAQKYYTEEHAVQVEDAQGNPTWERAYGELLHGSFSYHIATGSTLAWSESAQIARTMQLYDKGLIDKIEVYKRLNIPDWREIVKRMLTEDPRLAGPPVPQKPIPQSRLQRGKPNQGGSRIRGGGQGIFGT